jgi:protein arginine N-methyltransferase 1
LIYGTAFFPWTEAVALDGGDTVNVTLRADLVGDDYVWRWDSRVQGGGSTKAEFRQSTFFGSPLSSTTLRKQADRFQPALHDDGLIDSFILGLMTGELSSAEIARRVYERFSRRFARPAAALARVRELAVKYSR